MERKGQVSFLLGAMVSCGLGLAACGSDSRGPSGAAGAGVLTAGSGAAGDLGVAGTGAAGNGTAGTGLAGAGMAGTEALAGSGGTGAAGSGTAGSSTAGSGTAGTGSTGEGPCGLGLAAPANGFQVCTQGTMIAAGDDIEYCEVVTLPGSPSDTYYVGRTESQMTPYSHHLIITAAPPGSNVEAGMEDGERKPCLSGEQAFGQGLEHVAGSQRPYSDAAYPAGVGKIYHGGQKLSFDYHYFNTGDQAVPARAALNLHLVNEPDVKHVARQFGMYNVLFYVGAGKSGTFTKACNFSDDIMVWSLTRHTHRWGTDFTVNWNGGDQDGQHLWTSADWESDTDYLMPGGPLLMKAGTGFEFTCAFNNTTNHALTFGTSATDEMCILFGTYWKVNESDDTPDQGCQL